MSKVQTISTTQLTIDYIKEHPYIKNCLQKGLINYSSLSRLISKELKIEKKTSMEAILIAARRFQITLQKEFQSQEKIKELLHDSEIEIKNKIAVLIIPKTAHLDTLLDMEKKVKKEHGIFYLIEGSDNITIIIQEKHRIPLKTITSHKDLVLITLKSPERIETISGVIAYLTSLFAENGVNIVEFLSCWRDTLFLIHKKDVEKALRFLHF